MDARDLSCPIEQKLDAKIAIGFALIKEAPFPLTVRLAIDAQHRFLRHADRDARRCGPAIISLAVRVHHSSLQKMTSTLVP